MLSFIFSLILSANAELKKYVIENKDGTPAVVLAEGFVPKDAVPGPVGEYEASDLVKSGKTWTIDASAKAKRLAAEAAAAKAEKDSVALERDKVTQLKALYAKLDSLEIESDLKSILKLMIEVQYK